jgi:hypothetical protein
VEVVNGPHARVRVAVDLNVPVKPGDTFADAKKRARQAVNAAFGRYSSGRGIEHLDAFGIELWSAHVVDEGSWREFEEQKEEQT